MTVTVGRALACSIVLPTYNRAPLLGEAIESVIAQTRSDWELLVVDDGSTDETPSVVARYVDSRIRFLGEPHRGRSAARNRGVELAVADLVGFLDSDDRLLPHALDAHLRAHSAEPNSGMTVAGYERIDAFGAVIGIREPWAEGGELTPEGWLLNCFGIPGTVMVRRNWLARVRGFGAQVEPAEDWDLFLRLSLADCPMTWIRESACQYREHEGGSTRRLDDRLGAIFLMFDTLASDPELPADARGLIPTARAWACASLARAAAALGDDDQVRRCLRLARDSRRFRAGALLWVSADGFDSLVEPVAAELAARTNDETELPGTAERWGVSLLELRRALARVAMKAFFAAVERGGRAEASGQLRRGLRRDPRWLTDRGVIGFLLGRRRRAN